MDKPAGKPGEYDFNVLMPEELKRLNELKATEYAINQVISTSTAEAISASKKVFLDTQAWWEDVTSMRDIPKPGAGCNYRLTEENDQVGNNQVGFIKVRQPTPGKDKEPANDSNT